MGHTTEIHPLLRSVIGIDRVFDGLDALAAGRDSYPPYDIEQTGDDTYRIVMAVAGFKADDLSIEVKDSTLTIKGKAEDESKRRYVHRGIARRAFVRSFTLAEYVKVASASLADGLLGVECVREIPESAKPRTVEISVS